ncbi:lanthionine synthetase C family protein [Myxococcus sp. K38C18041901]|uniref:lanthionine synthetase C family protein n=1 Tax=Myxococcus guangdongensis TaxID=2906760 RepID=UPI0020A80C60|nr:lanthionine synthetase C family protein [Myxococcus guangdongensis]MCP3061802.1 lanthionine synthetase C family protein [Myxococcus guangdongensis]
MSGDVDCSAKWRPLVEGALREEVLRVVHGLARALAEMLPGRAPDASLASGDSGLALLFAWLDKVDASEDFAGVARGLLDDAMEAVASRPMGMSLHSGVSGVAWALEHLGEGDDALEEVDAALAERLVVAPWTGPVELLSGLVGLGVYALERLPRVEARRCLEGVVARLGETWRRESPEGGHDLGVAHGVPGVIAVLAGAVRAGVAESAARGLLDDVWSWVMAQRLPQVGRRFPHQVVRGRTPRPARAAWCYGDPGVSLVLFTAARDVGESRWESDALELARDAAMRPLEDSGVKDAPLCHGSAGLLHIYNRFHQATGEELFESAARRWLEHVLRSWQPGRGIGGYAFWGQDARGAPAWVERPGLLEGTAGIALTLLAAASAVEPSWDRVLLMSLRDAE